MTVTGFYSFPWKPDIEGKYTVYVSYRGSESYWPSEATTAFEVQPLLVIPTPTSIPLSQSIVETYFLPAVATIIIVIIVIGALILLRVRKPQ